MVIGWSVECDFIAYLYLPYNATKQSHGLTVWFGIPTNDNTVLVDNQSPVVTKGCAFPVNIRQKTLAFCFHGNDYNE